MKFIYGGVPYNTTKIKHYEVPTNDCDMVASDLQAGKTGVARGRKIIGTGKSFEFAYYGTTITNLQEYMPSLINVVEITSVDYPIKSLIGFDEMIGVDFTTERTIGVVVIDNIEYPINIKVEDNILIFSCEKTISLEFFYGKDNYI